MQNIVAHAKQCSNPWLSLKTIIRISQTVLIAVFLSNWLNYDYNLLQGPSIKGEILLLGLLGFSTLRLNSNKANHKIIRFVAVLSAVVPFIVFYSKLNGTLTTDDHSTFLFRLQLLKAEFPNIPFYFPLWNSGVEARDFFASGILNVFTIFSPLIYFYNLEHAYTLITAILLFFIPPVSSFYATKIITKNKDYPLAPWIAAILVTSSSLTWYRWALEYGTLGFMCSVSLLPPVFSLSINALENSCKKLSLTQTIALTILTSLAICWSLTAVILLPLVLEGIFKIPNSINKLKFVLIGLVLINISWMILFWRASNVGKFLVSEDSKKTEVSLNTNIKKPHKVYKHKPSSIDLKKSIKTLKSHLISSNPAIIIFGIVGLFFLLTRLQFISYSLICFWLFLLGAVMFPLKPQLELDRMLVVLNIILAVPASLALTKVIKFQSNKFLNTFSHWLFVPLDTVTLGFLFAGIFSVVTIASNHSLVKFNTRNSNWQDIKNTINFHGGRGRTLFTGFVLHELDRSHLAPLATEIKRPLVASSHLHNKWKYTDVIPESFIKNNQSKGVKKYYDFFDINNSSLLVAHEQKWINFFNQDDKNFKFLKTIGKFNFYKRLNFIPNYFLSGQGEIVEQNFNSITFIANTSSGILKFNYLNFLKIVDSNDKEVCSISSEELYKTFNLIKFSSCPTNTILTIKSRSPFYRMLNG